MSEQLFKQTLKQYGHDVGLGTIVYDDIHGTCLEFGQSLELCVSWHRQNSIVYSYGFCGFVPSDNKSKLFEEFLAANYFWANTGGATLAFDNSANAIYLIGKWDKNVYVSVESFTHHINMMVNQIERWQTSIASGDTKNARSVHAQSQYAINKIRNREAI